MYCQSCGADNRAEHSTCFACHHALDLSTALDEDVPLLNQRYRLLNQVGAGGYGAVYKARDTQANGECPMLVAIKQTNLRGLTPQEAIEATDTFHREVTLLSHLKHNNLPCIYEHFTDPEHWYLVMDFIEGETLEDYLRQGSVGTTETRILSVDEVCQIGLQLCEVLHYLHTCQPAIIFRDLKPANIMRTPKGHLFLIDFGIARHFKPGQTRDTIPLGSPGYAAPEQYGKRQTTPQSDLYSLGALLHQLLSREDPAENAFHFAPLRLSGGERAVELEALLTDLVEIDSRKRPESAAQVTEVLLRISEMGQEARIWQAPIPQEPLPWHPPYSWQLQQSQPRPKTGLSRRNTLKLTGGLLGLVALIGGVEALAALSRRDAVGVVSSQPPPVTNIEDLSTRTVPSSSLARLIYRGHTNTVFSLSWSTDDKFVASTDSDSLQVWQPTDGKRVYLNRIPGGTINAAAWSPDGGFVADVENLEGKGSLKGWIPLLGGQSQAFHYPVTSGGWAQSLAWSPDGQLIAVGSSDGIKIFTVAGGAIVFQRNEDDQIPKVVWSPNGRYLAWYKFGPGVEVWDMATHRQVFTHPALTGNNGNSGMALAWSPDGKFLAWSSDGSIVQIWDTASWQPAYTIATHDFILLALAWSPDSRSLAWGGNNGGPVHVWTVAKGLVFTYSGHTDGIETLAWSHDGHSIASAGADKTVQIWEPQHV